MDVYLFSRVTDIARRRKRGNWSFTRLDGAFSKNSLKG